MTWLQQAQTQLIFCGFAVVTSLPSKTAAAAAAAAATAAEARTMQKREVRHITEFAQDLDLVVG